MVAISSFTPKELFKSTSSAAACCPDARSQLVCERANLDNTLLGRKRGIGEEDRKKDIHRAIEGRAGPVGNDVLGIEPTTSNLVKPRSAQTS